MSHIIYVK